MKHQCSCTNCYLTLNKSHVEKADLLLIHGNDLGTIKHESLKELRKKHTDRNGFPMTIFFHFARHLTTWLSLFAKVVLIIMYTIKDVASMFPKLGSHLGSVIIFGSTEFWNSKWKTGPIFESAITTFVDAVLQQALLLHPPHTNLRSKRSHTKIKPGRWSQAAECPTFGRSSYIHRLRTGFPTRHSDFNANF